MYNNFSNDIAVSIATIFEERIITIEYDTFMWEYTISVTNKSDKYIRLKLAEFSFVNEFGDTNQVEVHEFNDNNVVLAPGSIIKKQGVIYSHNSSSIVFGKIFAFDELDKEFSAIIPTFSLDSPYFFYKTVQ